MNDELAQKPMTKTDFLTSMAERTQLDKKQVADFLDKLGDLIAEQLSEQGPGSLNIPGLMRVKVNRKPAQPERQGIHPITKEETTFKAKPAQNVVKLVPLKGLKDKV
jgi:nucleoid DNA-binding protein